MHLRLRTVLSCFLLAALLFSASLYAQEQTPVLNTRALISALNVEINGEAVDQQNSLYPLLNYNDITYFPLTWNYGQALGFSVTLSEEGLSIIRSQAIPGLNQDLLPEGSPPFVLGGGTVATMPTFPITLQEQTVSAESEWPFLFYKDITYMPFTWDYATALGISYTFDIETSTLSIASADEPPVTKPPVEEEPTLVEPAPETPIIQPEAPKTPQKLASLLENGRTITAGDLAKMIELNKDSAQQTTAASVSFDADFSLSATDLIVEPITGVISGAWDAEEMKIHFNITIDSEAPALSLPDMQMFIRPNPDNADEMQVFIQAGSPSWEIMPMEIPMLKEQLALGLNGDETDEETLENAAKMLEDMGLDSLAQMVRNPEDTTALVKLFSIMEFEEITIDGTEIIRLGYVGDILGLCEALDIDLTKVYTKIMGLENMAENPLYAEMSPQELEELQALLEESIAQTVEEATKMQIAFAIDFDAAGNKVLQYAYRYLMPMGLDTLTMDMIMDFVYDEETDELNAFNISVEGHSEGGVGFKGVIEWALDYDSEYDWSTLDEEVAEVLPNVTE